jgi:hypothetical protein
MKNKTKNQNQNQNVKSIGEKLKTKDPMLFISFFSCDLQYFKAFGASLLYRVESDMQINCPEEQHVKS